MKYIKKNLVGDKSDAISSTVEGCVTDMCALSNDTKIDQFRCDIYNEFNLQCLELAVSLNQSWTMDWRIPTNCRNNFKL